MDTKSKSYNKILYHGSFWLCIAGLLTCCTCFVLLTEYTDRTYMMYDDNPWLLLFPNNYKGNGGFYAETWGVYGAELALIRKNYIIYLLSAIGGGLLSIISLVVCLVHCGQAADGSIGAPANGEGGIVLKKIDRCWTELQIVIFFAAFSLGGTGFFYFIFEGLKTSKFGGYASSWVQAGDYNDFIYSTPLQVSLALAVFIGIVTAWIGLAMLTSMVRKLKGHVFLKNSLFGLVLWEPIRSFYRGGSLMRKVVIISVLFCVASATVFLAPVVLIFILVFAPRMIKKYEAVKNGIEEVKNGNLKYQIPVEPGAKGELDNLARDINAISEAQNIAVQNEIKNQRMKTELISNVSHDLKTPLTSMVTYIDLLKTEGLESEKAPEYLDILERKTQRLRQLTEDLFEAAKASSGAMPVNIERIDFCSILNQAMGELGEKIEGSDLEFIVNAPQEKCFVMADGQLLWRVIDNLIGNALKYAQERSRVYVDIRLPALGTAAAFGGADPSCSGSSEGGGGNCAACGNGAGSAESETVQKDSGIAVLEIKNMSRQALNIDAGELMERFKRGDESRATEGSGLGLAIAKDLVKLMGGWLEISIDGDLFKAQVMLPRCE